MGKNATTERAVGHDTTRAGLTTARKSGVCARFSQRREDGGEDAGLHAFCGARAVPPCAGVGGEEARVEVLQRGRGGVRNKLDKVVMTPDPAQAGKDINVTINGNIEREIKGGKLELQVLFHKVPVYKETDELCDRVVTECPTKGGDWVINAVQKLPSFTLPGSYELEVTATDEAGTELVCLVMAFDIQQPFLSVS